MSALAVICCHKDAMVSCKELSATDNEILVDGNLNLIDEKTYFAIDLVILDPHLCYTEDDLYY